jgi:hypothetical protein
MRVVQALHWLKDAIATDSERIATALRTVLEDPDHGKSVRHDLAAGFSVIPGWMQTFVRDLLEGNGTGPVT